jgi:hypothetical protein
VFKSEINTSFTGENLVPYRIMGRNRGSWWKASPGAQSSTSLVLPGRKDCREAAYR